MKRIYLHGLGQSSGSWSKVINQLVDAEHSLCPDLAELVQGQKITYQNLYAAFSNMCDTIEEEIGICGLSLGGVLALNYAIEHSERVKSLVLIATQYKMPKKLLRFQNTIFHFMPKSMFQQTGFEKADFLKLCSTMMELDFSNSLKKSHLPDISDLWREG